MGFSAKQVLALKRNVDHRHIRTREANGRELTYIEGWYAISEANRIFGFDGWNRETFDSKCVLTRESRGSFLAVYTARVRITVQADGITIVREGHGTGEGRGSSPGEVHDIALKAAETDATKRALATFGKPFGLALYAGGKATVAATKSVVSIAPSVPAPELAGLAPPIGFARDDTTPIPRPSTFYGRRQNPVSRDLAAIGLTRGKATAPSETQPPADPSIVPSQSEFVPSKIDKSVLTIAEPKRIRDKAHLKFVASQPCLICGRQPCDPHHLRFAQPRAIGMKVSDEFTVPLCRGHHRQLHQVGNEVAWWKDRNIDALVVANELWRQNRSKETMDIL
jgi:hypothetical protein